MSEIESSFESCGRLENWTLVRGGIGGHVFGHAKYPDGHDLFTSIVRRCFYKDSKRMVRTRTNTYELGETEDGHAMWWFFNQVQQDAAKDGGST